MALDRLQSALSFLASRGTLRMIGYMLRENSAMQAFVRSHGFSVDAVASDVDALHFVRTLGAGDAK